MESLLLDQESPILSLSAKKMKFMQSAEYDLKSDVNMYKISQMHQIFHQT